jgi:hypothetical protein
MRHSQITKNTMYTYLQLPNTPFIRNVEKTSKDHMYLSNKYSRMSRLQVCLDMYTQSKITQDVT